MVYVIKKSKFQKFIHLKKQHFHSLRMTDGGRERLRLYSNAPPLSWQTFKPIHVSAARARLTDRTPQTISAFPKYETIILKPGGRLQGEMVEEAESIRAPPSKKLG